MANCCGCGERIEEGDEICDDDGNVFCSAMCLEEHNETYGDDL